MLPRSSSVLGLFRAFGCSWGRIECARDGWRLAFARHYRTRKIHTRQLRDALAELVAQHAGAHLLDRAFRQLGELERAERNADEAIHLQAEVPQHVADFAVLAFTDRKGEPDIRALGSIERRLDRSITHAFNLDAIARAVECVLRDRAECAHTVAPQPSRCRQFQHAGKPAVVGKKQQTLAAEIEPSDADQARQIFGKPPKIVGRPCGSACVVTSRAACCRGRAACARASASGCRRPARRGAGARTPTEARARAQPEPEPEPEPERQLGARDAGVERRAGPAPTARGGTGARAVARRAEPAGRDRGGHGPRGRRGGLVGVPQGGLRRGRRGGAEHRRLGAHRRVRRPGGSRCRSSPCWSAPSG